MLRCQPYDFSSCSIPATVGKQQKGTRRNHGCSSSWTTTWILGVALASFLLTVALNVSSSFAAKRQKWADCWSRLRHIQSAHKKKPRKTENICTATRHNVTHSNEERNTIRGRVAPSSQRQHTTFTVINPNKEVAHDAVKCGSPDGLARRNSGWRSARKRDRPASDATLARKIAQRCASRQVQTCNNSEKRR